MLPTTRVVGMARRLRRCAEAPFALDTGGNGFAPWSSLLPLPFTPGSTLVNWQLRAVVSRDRCTGPPALEPAAPAHTLLRGVKNLLRCADGSLKSVRRGRLLQ